jgi:hypothetical protein
MAIFGPRLQSGGLSIVPPGFAIRWLSILSRRLLLRAFAGVAVLAWAGMGLLLLTALAALVVALLLADVGGLVIGTLTWVTLTWLICHCSISCIPSKRRVCNDNAADSE